MRELKGLLKINKETCVSICRYLQRQANDNNTHFNVTRRRQALTVATQGNKHSPINEKKQNLICKPIY